MTEAKPKAAPAVPTEPPPIPRGELARIGDAYHFVAVDGAWALEWSRLQEHRDGPTAEVRGVVSVTGRSSPPTKVTLTSAISRNAAVKSLDTRCPGPPWAAMLDHVVTLLLAAWRGGERGREVVAERPAPDRWLWPELIPLRGTTIIFGDGSTGKSYMGLALAIASRAGVTLAGRYPVAPSGAVLWLDWEDDYDTFAGRLWGLAQPLGLSDVPGIIHRKMSRSPLTEALPYLKAEIAESGVELVIVDSLAPASGPEPEGSDAAVRTLDALGTLPCTRLVLAHVSKQMAEDPSRPARPYGSVFVQNLARSTIEAKKAEAVSDDTMTVTYYHRKSNRGGLVRPFALEWMFDPSGAVGVRVAEPDLQTSGLTPRLLGALKYGQQTVAALAEELGTPGDTVRKQLHRLENRGTVSRFTSSDGGRGRESLWGLTLINRDINRDKP